MRETCTSGSVRGEGGNILTYSAQNRASTRATWLDVEGDFAHPTRPERPRGDAQSREWRAVVGMPYNCRCRNSDPIAQTQAK